MNKTISKLALLAFSLAGLYGQTTAHAVVPASSIGPGQSRPYIWYAQATPALAHVPGQTSCNSSNPCYYNPADLWIAYATQPFFNKGYYGQGITIAIVDAYYNSQTVSDLTAFSTSYNLPLSTGTPSITCPSAPTVTVVSQTGGTPTAGFDSGWAQETDLDTQWAHAIAPCANLLLVTATDNSNANLFTAVQYAYAHADLVSNSYGGTDSTSDTSLDSTYFSATTVPLLFSAGDTDATVQYPCTSPYATCIGGTNLLTTSAAVRTLESAWNDGSGEGTGGGCSVSGGEPEPTFQSSPSPGFSNADCGSSVRGVPDIAALADPYSGVALYEGSNIAGTAGLYCCIGGTSLASPVSAGLLALVDNEAYATCSKKLNNGLNNDLYAAAHYTPSGSSVQPAPYGNAYRSFFYDVYSGNTGFPATPFWDRTTGLGVPLPPALGNYLVKNVVCAPAD